MRDSLVRPWDVVTSWRTLATWLDAQEQRDDNRKRAETLRYVWEWCRTGVYVWVRGGKLMAFVPFANTQFRNTWKLQRFLPERRSEWPAEAQSSPLPLDSWWCNAGILCTRPGPRPWSSELLPEFARFIAAAAARVPHVEAEFMLNKRDFPCVRRDGLDPYGATFFDSPTPATAPRGQLLLPFLSCFVGDLFCDIPIPLAQDHQAVEGSWPLWKSKKEFMRDWWSCRAPRAVFRGTATGCGVTPETNPRLRLAQLARQHPDLLDVHITGCNSRLRKHPQDDRLRVLEAGADDVDHSAWLSLDDQSSLFRFAVCIEGHSATGRLAALLRRGFLVFLVATVSAPADKTHCCRAAIRDGCVVECSIEDLPRTVRHFVMEGGAQDAARRAWRAVCFYHNHLAPRALEAHLADVISSVGN